MLFEPEARHSKTDFILRCSLQRGQGILTALAKARARKGKLK
jgi:hypothetical protein